MELSNLPTDNFYIFLSLAGLSIIFFSVSSFLKQRNIIRLKSYDIEKEIAKVNTEVSDFDSKLSAAESHIRIFKIKLEKEYNIELNDYLSTENEIKKALHEKLTLEQFNKTADAFLKLQEVILERQMDFHAIGNLKTVLKINTKALDKIFSDLKGVTILSFIGLLTGVLISTFGFCFWFNKHQVYQDKLIKLEYENAIIPKNKSIIDSSSNK